MLYETILIIRMINRLPKV